MSEASDREALYARAVGAVIEAQKASTSYVQRTLGINYGIAMELIGRMQVEGIVSAPNTAGKRDCLYDAGPGVMECLGLTNVRV